MDAGIRSANFPLRAARLGLALAALAVTAACSADAGDPCRPGDVDGVVGGKYMFEVTVDDEGFAPAILKAQNTAEVTVVLRNGGTSPHGFAVACIATPNDTGCPTRSCFPDSARVAPIDPGESATLRFTLPLVEGIYPIGSGADGDTQKAQFVVQ